MVCAGSRCAGCHIEAFSTQSEAAEGLGSSFRPSPIVPAVALFRNAFWQDAASLQSPSPTAPLERTGPVANLFPGCIDGVPVLTGLVSGEAAHRLAGLSEQEQRREVRAREDKMRDRDVHVYKHILQPVSSISSEQEEGSPSFSSPALAQLYSSSPLPPPLCPPSS